MSLIEEQCKKVCRILDDVLANRPTERDSLIVATRKAFKALAEPKRGKWIYHIDDLFPAESTMECNQCHAEQPLTCDDEFCPHCGADMRGVTT